MFQKLLKLLRPLPHNRGMTEKTRASERPDVTAEIRGGDPDQGMTDETDLGSASLEEAMFWTKVYSEILAMEEQVLSRIHELMALESAWVRREVEESNLPVIQAQVDRFRLRHDKWKSRVTELEEPAV